MQQKLLHTKQREFFYGLYSRLFMKEIDIDFLKIVEKKDIKEFFPNLFEWDEYKKLSKEDLINNVINVDFTNISIINLIPYETFYTREDGQINSGGENPIYEFFDQFDFNVEKDKARIVSPDHIGVELEFMHKLCNSQTKALENSDEIASNELEKIQKDFMEKHLLNWVPLYLINVKNEAQTPLYHDGAMMGLEFLLSDYEYLNE